MSINKLSRQRQGFFKSLKVGLSGAPAQQVAAICTRTKNEKRQVLLVTSRRTGRWVIPKGWPMFGLSDGEAAAQEAWEEAGIADAKISNKPIGKYSYEKVLSAGGSIPVRVNVYRLKVLETVKKFPESKQRTRKWVSPRDASEMVREPELKKILVAMHK